MPLSLAETVTPARTMHVERFTTYRPCLRLCRAGIAEVFIDTCRLFAWLHLLDLNSERV